MHKFHFLAGLPRSGTTLLAAILSQNPRFHASATSALPALISAAANVYHQNQATVASSVEGQCAEVCRSIADGLYAHIDKPVIFDKNRAWPGAVPMLEEIFGYKPKILCPVRPIPEVIVSFIKLMRENGELSSMEKQMVEMGIPLTDKGRCEYLMSVGGVISSPWATLKQAYESKFKDSLLLIEYDDIVSNTEATFDKIYQFLEEDPYQHDFSNIVNQSPERDDDAWGLKNLHTIQPDLKKRSLNPQEVLGDTLFKFYNHGAFWRGPDPEPEKGVLDLQREAFYAGNYELARSYCDQAAEDDDRAQFNKGWYLLAEGKLLEGMKCLNRGRARQLNGKQLFGSPLPTSQPVWDGRNISGSTVLLALEGGLGDSICNARFARDLAARGIRVILSGPASLAELLLKVEGVSAYVQTEAAGGVYHDYVVPASSAVLPLKYQYPDIKGTPFISYKKIPHDRKRIGIRWCGFQKFELEHTRAIDPQKLFAIDNADLVSLQRDDYTNTVVPKFVEQPPLNSWIDTYNVMRGLDLVITSCTSVAHLAAAMGIPTYVILPGPSDYFTWAMPGNKTVWYDSVTLFRGKNALDEAIKYAQLQI